MGGVPKTEILHAFRPHIFFDDQESHCRPASTVVPTARVPLALEIRTLDVAAPIDPEHTTETSTEAPESVALMSAVVAPQDEAFEPEAIA